MARSRVAKGSCVAVFTWLPFLHSGSWILPCFLLVGEGF